MGGQVNMGGLGSATALRVVAKGVDDILAVAEGPAVVGVVKEEVNFIGRQVVAEPVAAHVGGPDLRSGGAKSEKDGVS